MHRDSVVSGSLRPFMPSAFGQKVGNACGVLSSPMQRGTHGAACPSRVDNCTQRLVVDEDHIGFIDDDRRLPSSMPRNSVASLISTQNKRARH